MRRSNRYNFILKIVDFIKYLNLARGKIKLLNIFLIKLYLKINKQNSIFYNYQGKNFELYPLDNITDLKILSGSKIYDSNELKFLHDLEKNNNSIFLDIGSNMGYYSIMSSDYGFSKIYSFEPIPDMVLRLKKNIQLNKLDNLIEVIPFAIGDKNKKIPISKEISNIGGSSIKSNHTNDSIIVDMVTLHDFLKVNSIQQIDALKIDIEGFEDKALKIFFDTCQSNLFPKMIIIEHTSMSEWDFNLFDLFNLLNYKVVYKNRSNTILKL